MANRENVLIPFTDSEDIQRIMDLLVHKEGSDRRYILLKLLDKEQSRMLSRRMNKDFHLLLAELEDDGWKSLYFFQEEFKAKGINVRIVLRTGNIIKEIHELLKEYSIETVIVSRSVKTGLAGKMKADLINDLMLSSEKMIIIL